MLYNTPRPGGTLTGVYPGDTYTPLFDGTETPGAGVASIAIERGPSSVGSDNGTTFQMIFPAAPTAALAIQGSNVDEDAAYEDLYVSTNTQYDNYTDTTRWRFYRAKLNGYTSGGMPRVVVQR